MHCNTPGVRAQGFLQDFFCLQVTTIGQVDVGFGNRVDVVCRV